MLERLRTIVLVTLLAVTFWLFAEAESLGQFSGIATVRFMGGENGERLVRPAERFDGSVTVDLVGTKAAVDRVRLTLSSGLELEPGMAGLPTTEGRHTVNLLQVLQNHPALRGSGAQVTSVRPQIVDLIVTELTTQQIPIEPVLTGLEVVGAVRVTPERATIRLPRAAWELNQLTPGSLRASARLTDAQRRALPASGAARAEARLEAPESVAALPGFALVESTATLEFIIRSRSVTQTITSVPVQVVLPPIEVGRWNVQVDAEDRFLDVQASGSAERVERLTKKEDAVIAVVSLSSDDLAQRAASRPVSLIVLRQGAVAATSDLDLLASKAVVRLTIEPITSASGAGSGAPADNEDTP